MLSMRQMVNWIKQGKIADNQVLFPAKRPLSTSMITKPDLKQKLSMLILIHTLYSLFFIIVASSSTAHTVSY